jgi:preprotein translocase subunit SecA
VDGEGGVVEGEFADEPADAVPVGDGTTRAERRKAAKGGRRRKK